MAEGVKQVRSQIRRDKRLAKEVVETAEAERDNSITLPVAGDITGYNVEQQKEFTRWKHQSQAALDDVRRRLYFARVDTQIQGSNGRHERLSYLVSKGRLGGPLGDGDWMVVSWTAPITKHIVDAPVGHQFEYAPPRRPGRQYCIQGSAKFGTILPALTATTYGLPSGEYYVDHENDVLKAHVDEAAAKMAEQRPEPEYQATGEFGLREIITLADRDQRSAMLLPFHDTVVVEGPPGSGKTSIGLMRVPCLIDQQWDELELDRTRHRPFHSLDTMQVLVMNEEMIDYLRRLIESVNVHGIPVTTFGQFCRRMCREAGVFGGRRAREERNVTQLKLHPQMPDLYWRAFRAWIERWWSRRANTIHKELVKAGGDVGRALADELERWTLAVLRAEDLLSGANVNLAERLDHWFVRTESSGTPEVRRRARESRREAEVREDVERQRGREGGVLRALREAIRPIVRDAFDRAGIVDRLLQDPGFRDVGRSLLGATPFRAVVREWRAQAKGEHQAISEGDLALAAWLGSYTMLVPGVRAERPVVGGVAPRLTHVVVDEAQDVSPVHVRLLQRLVHRQGTMTLVGDLRQRVTAHSFFERWEDLGLEAPRRAMFAVNHRQSQPLGEFIRALHHRLYDEWPAWRASDRRAAPCPRIRRQRGTRGLAQAVADEVRHWRNTISGQPTVAVLFHDRPASGLARFAQRIEDELGDTLTEVRLAVGKSRAHQLNQTDCTIIATVIGTKGLEFDAVVVIDPRSRWCRSLAEIDSIQRNGLYVAASRAKQGLSLVIDDRSELLADGSLAEHAEIIS